MENTNDTLLIWAIIQYPSTPLLEGMVSETYPYERNDYNPFAFIFQYGSKEEAN